MKYESMKRNTHAIIQIKKLKHGEPVVLSHIINYNDTPLKRRVGI